MGGAEHVMWSFLTMAESMSSADVVHKDDWSELNETLTPLLCRIWLISLHSFQVLDTFKCNGAAG